MHHNYWLRYAVPWQQPLNRSLWLQQLESRDQHLCRGFESVVAFVGKKSARFTCYGWENSGVPHQDITSSRDIAFLAPFISWKRPAPKWAEDGIATGGDVTPAMIEALLNEPVNGTISPVFALELEAEDGEKLLTVGDYSDIIVRLTEDEAGILRQSFKESGIAVSLENA